MRVRNFNKLLKQKPDEALLYVTSRINKYSSKSLNKVTLEMNISSETALEIKSILASSSFSSSFLRDKKKQGTIKTMFRILHKLSAAHKKKKSSNRGYKRNPKYGGGNVFDGNKRKPVNKLAAIVISRE